MVVCPAELKIRSEDGHTSLFIPCSGRSDHYLNRVHIHFGRTPCILRIMIAVVRTAVPCCPLFQRDSLARLLQETGESSILRTQLLKARPVRREVRSGSIEDVEYCLLQIVIGLGYHSIS
ncbi:hypothetical protein BJX65DRAFT_114501 [Aspergillus insuetus]